MKSTIFAALVLAASLNSASAAEVASHPEAAQATDASEAEVDMSPKKDEAATNTLIGRMSDFCFFAETPPADQKYTVVKKLKVGKGTYGGVKDILPKLADHARKQGADAIMNYTGSQRFGFFPWRMVRPVVRGVAIKWTDPKKPDCAAMGGSTLQAILASDKAPEK
jgi:hypothetical protein